jgi:hypothetical protein
MRSILRLDTRPEEDKYDPSEVDEIARALGRYLIDWYRPERYAYSRYALLGPAGKLLAAASSGRLQGAEALLGFVVNVHANTSEKKLKPEGLDLLKQAAEKLVALRAKVGPREWLRLVRDLEYRVYFLKYEDVARRVADKEAQQESESTDSEGSVKP